MKQENIKVIVRVRPALNAEDQQCVEVDNTKQDEIMVTKDDGHKHGFTFDYVAGIDTKQIEMMQMIGKPITDNCLSGYNGTIFAYGQTGSGKTYTMKGTSPAENMGLMPNIFIYMFNQFKDDCEYVIKCSCLEIYKSSIKDLLDLAKSNLKIREDTNKKRFYVENLSTISCESAKDCLKLVQIATKNRKTHATSMNAYSSRSHLIFTVIITRRQMIHHHNINPKHSVKSRTCRLNLVDLAGSERQNRTQSDGDRLEEAKYINQSLSTLAKVVHQISESTKQMISFRDSILTKILKDSIGGDSLTFMVANISSLLIDRNETISTLRFAANAKRIRNTAKINKDIHPSLEALKAENSKFVYIVEELTKKYEQSQQRNTELNMKNEVLQSENHSLKLSVKVQNHELEELRSLNAVLSTQLNTKHQEYEELKSNDNENDPVYGSWVMVRSPIDTQNEYRNRKRSHKQNHYSTKTVKKRKITETVDNLPLSSIENRVLNQMEDETDWIISYIQRLPQLQMKELMKLLDEDTSMYINDNDWNLVKKEIETRLMRNPEIKANNNQWIDKIWRELKEEKTEQFIDSIFKNKCIKNLNDQQLIEIMDECKMKRSQLKQMEQERKRRIDNLIQKKSKGAILHKQQITNFEILLRITHHEEKIRRKLVENEMKKKVRSKGSNIYAM